MTRQTDTLTAMKMRATWDALASDPDAYVGDPERGRMELEGALRPARRGPARRHVRRGRLRPRPDDRGARGAIRPRARARRLPGDARTGARGRPRRARRIPRRLGRAARRRGRRERATSLVCYLVLQHLPVARRRSSPTSPSSPACSPRAARRSSNCRCSTTGSARAPGARSRSALVPLTARSARRAGGSSAATG